VALAALVLATGAFAVALTAVTDGQGSGRALPRLPARGRRR
jgi:hypothetical protein